MSCECKPCKYKKWTNGFGAFCAWILGYWYKYSLNTLRNTDGFIYDISGNEHKSGSFINHIYLHMSTNTSLQRDTTVCVEGLMIPLKSISLNCYDVLRLCQSTCDFDFDVSAYLGFSYPHRFMQLFTCTMERLTWYHDKTSLNQKEKFTNIKVTFEQLFTWNPDRHPIETESVTKLHGSTWNFVNCHNWLLKH